MSKGVNYEKLMNINDFNRRRRFRYCSYPPEGHEDDDPVSPQNTKTPVVNYTLPIVEKPQKISNSFKSISATVLAALIRVPSKFLGIIIIDCRYPFEFYGGHIKGAINIYSADELEKHFFAEGAVRSTLEGLLPVFYCEFSQMRGPAMAKYLRNCDISHHRNNMANIDFPEIYLLDRGYKAFWADETLRDLCEPRSYVSMHAQPYKHVLRQYDQHQRSKSVGEPRRSKREQMHVFSEEKLIKDEMILKMRKMRLEEEKTKENRRAVTPRLKLCFE